MRRREAGFTLIEILIAITLVSILSAVAIPAYSGYVLRGRLTEAFTALAAMQPRAEEFWSNNRTYVGLPAPASSAYFDYSIAPAVSASSFTVVATGKGAAADFVFTIDQNGNRATSSVPSGWTASTTCWVDRKGGKCVQ